MKISVSRTALLFSVLIGIALAVALHLGVRPASAAGAGPSLSVLPADLSLAQNESAEVTLIAGVPVSGVLSATLTSLSSDDYVIAILAPNAIGQPSGDLRFTALITRTPTSRSPGQALFALQYAMTEAGGSLSTHIVTAALSIANGGTVSPVLTINLQTVTNTLLDRRSRSAFLVLNNPGDNDVHVDGIMVLGEAFVGMDFTPPLTFPFNIAAQRSAIVTLTVAARDQVQPGSGLMLVQVDSSWERGKRRYQASQIMRSELDVGGYTASPVLTISLQTITNTLLDRISRNAFLVLNNTSDSDVRVDGIQALSEQFVAVNFSPTLTLPLTVAAQRSAIITLTVAARDQVLPGNWFILVQVDSSWERDKHRYQVSQIMRSDLDVGVYAENDILKALSLPILLLLPGAIFVWLLGKFLGKRVAANADTFKFDFAATRDFAAATVITSIIIVILYRFAGGIITRLLFGVSVARDITLAYGFVDIASIVFLAFISAGVVAAIIAGKSKVEDALAARKKREEEKQARITAAYIASLTLKEGDPEIVVIRKLVNNNKVFKDLPGWVYALQGPDKTDNLFVLMEDNTKTDMVWAAPPIRITWKNGQDENAKTFDQLKKSGALEDMQKLADLLEASLEKVTLRWARTVSGGSWPRLVKSSDRKSLYREEEFLSEKA